MTKPISDLTIVSMAARLSDYAEIDGVDASSRPVMPTDIRISWPTRDSSAHIVLSEITAADKWDADVCRFLDELPHAITPSDIVQIDREVERSSALP